MGQIFEYSTLQGCLDPLILNFSSQINLPSQPEAADDQPAIMQMSLCFFEVPALITVDFLFTPSLPVTNASWISPI